MTPKTPTPKALEDLMNEFDGKFPAIEWTKIINDKHYVRRLLPDDPHHVNIHPDDIKQFITKAFKAGQQDVLGRVEGSGKRYKNEKYSTDSFTISGKKWDKLKQELTDGE